MAKTNQPRQFTVQLNVLVSPAMRKRLRKLAKEKKISMGEAVRQLIEAAE